MPTNDMRQRGAAGLNLAFNIVMFCALIFFFFHFQQPLFRIIVGVAIVLNLYTFLNVYLEHRRSRREKPDRWT
ncbi:MAG: hypothetical protein P9M14_10785 [Candidatus Alcyoniella australis]|nr:hypothetical protein [Candidatus Alcyoniella australis]